MVHKIEEPPGLDRCIQRVKSKMMSRGVSAKDAESRAYSMCKSATGRRSPRESVEPEILEYAIPTKIRFVENEAKEGEQADPNKLYLSGMALKPGVSKNFVNFSKDEIKLGASSLENVKVLVNHDQQSVPFGKVIVSAITNDELTFVMEIDTSINAEVGKAIQNGYLDNVSIGASADSLTCDICKKDAMKCEHYRGQEYDGKVATVSPRGIKFHELSFVNFPGVTDAGVYNDFTICDLVDCVSEVKEHTHDIEKQKERKIIMEEEKTDEMAVLKKQLEELQGSLEKQKTITEAKDAVLQEFKQKELAKFKEDLNSLETKLKVSVTDAVTEDTQPTLQKRYEALLEVEKEAPSPVPEGRGSTSPPKTRTTKEYYSLVEKKLQEAIFGKEIKGEFTLGNYDEYEASGR